MKLHVACVGTVRRVLAILAVGSFAVACGPSGGSQPGAGIQTPIQAASQSTPPRSPGTLPPGVLAGIDVTGGPLGIGVGFGSVWVEAHRDHDLYRIDPNTSRVTAKIDLGYDACGLPSFGFGRVWVSLCMRDGTIAVDASTNQVVGMVSGGGLQPAMSDDSVWVGDLEGVERIDPISMRVVATVPVSGYPAYLTYGAGSIWTTNPGEGTVSRIDPSTNKIVATIPAGAPLGDSDDPFITFDFGAVWVNDSTSSDSSTIWRISPADNTAKPLKLPIGAAIKPSNLATGLGSLWIRTAGGPVYRFDPDSLAMTGSFPSDKYSGGFMVVGFDSIWATNIEQNTVWRIRI